MPLAPVSLYLHIPFCVRRCPYCNFYSTTNLELRRDFTAAMVRAIEKAPLEGRIARTIYFGGGTPSLLGESLIPVLEAVRRRLPVEETAEITLEANPGTVEPGCCSSCGRRVLTAFLLVCRQEMRKGSNVWAASIRRIRGVRRWSWPGRLVLKISRWISCWPPPARMFPPHGVWRNRRQTWGCPIFPLIC